MVVRLPVYAGEVCHGAAASVIGVIRDHATGVWCSRHAGRCRAGGAGLEPRSCSGDVGYLAGRVFCGDLQGDSGSEESPASGS